MEQTEYIEQQVEKAVDQLADLGTSVLILVTTRDGQNTKRFAKTRGDMYAAFGAARNWLLYHEEQTRAEARDHWNEDR